MNNARVLLICPSCRNQASVAASRFGEERYKVKCNKCAQRFFIDLKSGENCTMDRNASLAKHVNYKLFDPDSNDWQIENDACRGMNYDLAGIEILVRTHIVCDMTLIRPPGSSRLYKARELAQIYPFLAERSRAEDAERKAREEARAATLALRQDDDEDELDRSWYEMDCGEFFAHKLKPALTKDLFSRSTT